MPPDLRRRLRSTSDTSGFGCNPATRYTAIMASGLSDHEWTIKELVEGPRRAERGQHKWRPMFAWDIAGDANDEFVDMK